MTNSLNNIDWDKIKLYHGTNDFYLNSIMKKGFFIPIQEGNWLGKGTYFAVNNVFMPILYSNGHVKSYKEKDKSAKVVPAILEIEGKYLSFKIKDKILDLTVQKGLNLFHNISNEFSKFINPYEGNKEQKDEFDIFEKHFANSPFYNDDLKPNLIPNLEWLAFATSTNPTIKEFRDEHGIRLEELKKISNSNISNIIFAWFNYKYSCGIENEIPIRGVMAHFNTGTPISLSKVLQGKDIDRGFADYISYLNRTELSIFGYKYYGNNQQYWSFNDLFEDGNPIQGTHFKRYVDVNPIKNLLKSTFDESQTMGFKMNELDFEKLYSLLIEQHDYN